MSNANNQMPQLFFRFALFVAHSASELVEQINEWLLAGRFIRIERLNFQPIPMPNQPPDKQILYTFWLLYIPNELEAGNIRQQEIERQEEIPDLIKKLEQLE